MDWLRNRPFLNKQPRALLYTEEECDPQACFDSFKEHWQQVQKIISRTQQLPNHDDVLGIVNHLEQMVTLLVYDIKKIDQIRVSISGSKCLEYLLNENILEKLFNWGKKAGKYINAIRCEQLKIFEALVSQSRHVLLVHQSFLKPLLSLLISFQGEILSKEIEKFLVDLLNQLCALLMQNIDLIDLFFQKDTKCNKFIVFALLVPYVHREDSIGMRARDALLLCISLSRKNQNVAKYITDDSHFAPLIASGMSGLYSVLPNIVDDITVPDWHQLTPDDVNDIKGLSTFVTSLEFTNAVAQVAHLNIRRQLQEFIYRGFLIPVLGPALLQTSVDEQVAAVAYLELILRTVTHPGLLYSLLEFMLKMDYDGHQLLSILIERMKSEKQLCMVMLSLFHTMADLNCEDLMLELVFQYLQPCLHLMLSQRRTLIILDPHCRSFEEFLNLAPTCCDLQENWKSEGGIDWNHYGVHQTLYGQYNAYLVDAKIRIEACQIACSNWNNQYTGCEDIVNFKKFSGEFSYNYSSPSESIGYESLQLRTEERIDDMPYWQVSSNPKPQYSSLQINTEDLGSSTAGPFLTNLLELLDNFLSNSFYTNLHITGLLSRLAAYPQPLLRTYLLDHSLVLQPNVPSLFQIVGSLKQKIDEYMSCHPDSAGLIKYAKKFLIDRESRLVNARRHIVEQAPPTSIETTDHFQRNGPKRRSLNLPSLTTMFSRRSSQIESSFPLVIHTNENNFNALYPRFNEPQHVALCAVLLDEWVKELAALAQEHTIAQLATLLK